MAAPGKRRELDHDIKNHHENEEESDESSDDDIEEDVPEEQGMEIEVDFEGRNPTDPDFHGIKTLLQQLFLKAHVDLSELADLIIKQNHVGSVVKQSQDDPTSDDEDDDVNDVFGITTVINVSNKENVQCVRQLKELLMQLANDYATDAENAMIKNVLENKSADLGLLINERFVNIPAQISVPLLENLISEMKRAVNKNMPYNFEYYILICKLYKINEEAPNKRSKNKRKNKAAEPNILWSNPEEEIFAEEATCSFEFSVEKESDNGLTGTWTEDDSEMVPYRRVLLFESSKLQKMIDKIKTHLQ